MKNITPLMVVATICLAFSFSGMIVLAVVIVDLRGAFVVIFTWYLTAAALIYIRQRKYLSGR